MGMHEIIEKRETLIHKNEDLRKYISRLNQDLKRMESEVNIIKKKISLVNEDIIGNQEEFEKLGKQLRDSQ